MKRVQGHPGSKFIVPIKSPLLVFYLTSFESIVVSLTIFEIFDIKPIISIQAQKMVKSNSTSGLDDMDIPDFH